MRTPLTGKHAFRPIYRPPIPEETGQMTTTEFAKALEQLQLTHSRAAVILGIGRRSVTRYAAGQQEVPAVVERLLDLLIKHGIPKEYA